MQHSGNEFLGILLKMFLTAEGLSEGLGRSYLAPSRIFFVRQSVCPSQLQVAAKCVSLLDEVDACLNLSFRFRNRGHNARDSLGTLFQKVAVLLLKAAESLD